MLSNSGAKGDWDFRISDLVKNPDGTDILTLVVNFGEVRRVELAKSILLTSRDLFRSFKVCSDAKERVGCGKQREATAPIHLQPLFPSLQWKTCLLAELQPWCLSLQ